MNEKKIKAILIARTNGVFNNDWYNETALQIASDSIEQKKIYTTKTEMAKVFEKFFLENNVDFIKVCIVDIKRMMFSKCNVSSNEIRNFLNKECNLKPEKLQKYTPYNMLHLTTGMPYIINRTLFI